MKVEAHGATDIGLKRGHNEDSFLCVEADGLYMVADGMGGHSAGDVASRMAVETVANFYRETEKDDDVTWPFRMAKGLSYESNRMATGIKLANLRIFESARSNENRKGMGTTLVTIQVSRNGIIVGHVGDSRVYCYDGAHFEQVTEDHSLLNDYIRMKELTPEEIENFPHKNVIVRALGMRESVQVDVLERNPTKPVTFLLCSDGLNGMITDQAMQEILERFPDDLAAAATAMVDAANDAGGDDNITALLVRVTP